MFEPATIAKPSLLMRFVVAVFLAIGTFVGLALWFAHFNITLNWRDAYKDLHAVGSTCEGAVDSWRPDDSFDTIRARPHNLVSMPLPYRQNLVKPVIPPGGYLYARCKLDLSFLRQEGYGWMQLGNIFGASAIYMDGNLKEEVDDGNMAEFPLTIRERRDGVVLETISRYTDLGFPGLASLMPLVVSDDRSPFDRVGQMIKGWSVEMPVLRVGFAMAMLIAFGTAWMLGIRYPDVGWMIVVTSLLSIEAMSGYRPYGKSEHWHDIATATSRFSLALAFAAFLWTFLRVRMPKHFSVERLFFVLSILYLALNIALPAEIVVLINPRGGLRLYMGVAAYAWAGVYGMRAFNSLPPPRKWRVLIVSILAFAASAAYVVQILNVVQSSLLIDPFLNFAFAAVFSVILASDLVLYHREFFREKARGLKAAEAAARDSAVAQTTQMLAHDVRKPFSMLSTLLGQLSRGKLDQRSVDAQLVFVEQALGSIDAMLQDVMLLGAKVPPSTVPTPLVDLLKSAMTQVFRYRSSDIKLTYDFRHVHSVLVDVAKISRILINIFENAAQAMRDVGDIRVSTSEVDRQLELSVFNSGSFIAEADRERLFEPFVTKGKVGGTGLGLAVVRRIVELHGGTVRIESNRQTGTTFVVMLPTSGTRDTSAASTLPGHSSDFNASGYVREDKRHESTAPEILVIDDDPFIREAWHRELSAIRLGLFETPGAVLDALASQRLDSSRLQCIIIDYFFVDLEEETILVDFERLKAAVSCPILLSSDAALPERPKGIDQIIGKQPLDGERLKQMILNLKATA